MAVLARNFVTVFQVVIAKGRLNREITVITEELVTCRNINIVTVEGNAAQTAVGATTLEANLAGIPVYVLFTPLVFEIDGENPAVTFTLPGAAHHRCRDKGRKSHDPTESTLRGHSSVL